MKHAFKTHPHESIIAKSLRQVTVYALLSLVFFVCACAHEAVQIIATPQVIDAKLDSAVHSALLVQLDRDMLGEAQTEGHVVLLAEQGGDSASVYVIASVCCYGFENGLFTITSGSWSIPIAMRFSKSSDEYELIFLQQAADGDNYEASIKQLFPKSLWASVFDANRYGDAIKTQMEAQAKTYLQSIGRKAAIHSDYVEKENFRISTEAYNALTCMESLFDFPLWIGSRERICNGSRQIFEADEQDYDQYTVLTFPKKTYDGTVLQRIQYKIAGDRVEPL